MLGSTVVFQVLIHIRLECLQIGVFQRFLGYVSLVDRIEDLGLVHAGSHAFVVARQSCHRIGVSQILLQGIHTLGNDQTALAYDCGVSLELLGLHDLARIGINQRKLVATRTFSLDTQLEFGNLHTLIVRELDMHGEHTARLLINDRIVLFHAWGRDSAVFRITGVLSVIGGWFITAGAAFTICFFVAMIIHFGGTFAIIALIGLAIFSLIRSQVMYKKRKAKEKGNETIKQLMQSSNNAEILELLRKHTREELVKVLAFTEENLERTVTAFLHENLRGLRRSMGSVKFEKQLIKQMKRTGTLAMCRLDNNTVLEKGLYYYQGNDFASELVYSIGRLCEPCLEHIDNNFKPLDTIQKGEFSDVTEDIIYLLQVCRHKMENKKNNIKEKKFFDG